MAGQTTADGRTKYSVLQDQIQLMKGQNINDARKKYS